MNRRLRILLAVFAVCGLAAAACGGEVTEEADPAGDAAGTGDDPAPDGDDVSDGDVSSDAPEPASDSDASGAGDPAGAETGSDEAAGDEGGDAYEPLIFDDPRGGIFDEYQAGIDRRDHPFLPLDAFCHTHDPAPDRVATDTGIEADTVALVHLRSRLEDLIAIGFAVDVGNVAEIFDTFAAVVNEQCGGVRGRMIDLHTVEVPVLGSTVDEDRNAACIEATEDINGVILLNSSGFQGSANLCIVEEHATAFISTQGQPGEFVERGNDLLIALSPTLEESLRFLALDLVESGALEGKVIGVAAPDTPGQYEAVEDGLVNLLESNGIDVAVFDTIGCAGGTSCAEGKVESVQRMRDAGVNVFFNVLNVVSAPGYILEMATQGFKPGDVQFYASDFNSQAGELVSSKIVAFGGEAAGALYNGAIVVDDADTGNYRLEDYEPRAFNEMCNDVYGANSASGANHEWDEYSTGSSAYGMVSTVCNIMRTALRAIYEAGDNPTRADVYEALANMGNIDSSEMLPYSLAPGKTQAPDAIHTLRFEYPCTKGHPFGAENTCIYPIDEYRLVQR